MGLWLNCYDTIWLVCLFIHAQNSDAICRSCLRLQFCLSWENVLSESCQHASTSASRSREKADSVEFFSAFINGRHQVNALVSLLLAELDELDFMMPPAMRKCNQVKCNQRLITQSSKAFLNIPIKSLNNTKNDCERIEMLPLSVEEPKIWYGCIYMLDQHAGLPLLVCVLFKVKLKTFLLSLRRFKKRFSWWSLMILSTHWNHTLMSQILVLLCRGLLLV